MINRVGVCAEAATIYSLPPKNYSGFLNNKEF
jgi:hypothetical protein